MTTDVHWVNVKTRVEPDLFERIMARAEENERSIASEVRLLLRREFAEPVKPRRRKAAA